MSQGGENLSFILGIKGITIISSTKERMICNAL